MIPVCLTLRPPRRLCSGRNAAGRHASRLGSPRCWGCAYKAPDPWDRRRRAWGHRGHLRKTARGSTFCFYLSPWMWPSNLTKAVIDCYFWDKSSETQSDLNLGQFEAWGWNWWATSLGPVIGQETELRPSRFACSSLRFVFHFSFGWRSPPPPKHCASLSREATGSHDLVHLVQCKCKQIVLFWLYMDTVERPPHQSIKTLLISQYQKEKGGEIPRHPLTEPQDNFIHIERVLHIAVHQSGWIHKGHQAEALLPRRADLGAQIFRDTWGQVWKGFLFLGEEL